MPAKRGPRIIDGKKTSGIILEELKAEVAALRAKAKIDKPADAVAPAAIRQGELLQN